MTNNELYGICFIISVAIVMYILVSYINWRRRNAAEPYIAMYIELSSWDLREMRKLHEMKEEYDAVWAIDKILRDREAKDAKKKKEDEIAQLEYKRKNLLK